MVMEGRAASAGISHSGRVMSIIPERWVTVCTQPANHSTARAMPEIQKNQIIGLWILNEGVARYFYFATYLATATLS